MTANGFPEDFKEILRSRHQVASLGHKLDDIIERWFSAHGVNTDLLRAEGTCCEALTQLEYAEGSADEVIAEIEAAYLRILAGDTKLLP